MVDEKEVERWLEMRESTRLRSLSQLRTMMQVMAPYLHEDSGFDLEVSEQI
jgi:hypothetical protein